MENKWIKVSERLPNKKEQSLNWKFLVGNDRDDWVDASYYDEDNKESQWNNGECDVIPTHWMPLPKPPTQ